MIQIYDNNNMRKGFTLIELLVVIAVIGILAGTSFAIINPAKQLQKSRDAKRKADLAQIQSALELYRSDQGAYPASLPACGASLSVSGTVYLRSRPCDPHNPTRIYNYLPGSPANSYAIIACLENYDDTQKDASNNASYCSGGGSSWSYTVLNP